MTWAPRVLRVDNASTQMSSCRGEDHTTYLDNIKSDRRSTGVSILHVAFQVHIEKLENQIQFLIRVNDVEESVKSKSSMKEA